MTSEAEHSELFKLCREFVSHLGHLHTVVKGRLPVWTSDVEVVRQQFTLIFKTEFTIINIKDCTRILTQFSDVMTDLGRLLYAMGTSYETNTLYTWTDDLKMKLKEAKGVLKIVKEKITIDDVLNEDKDVAEYVWNTWFKDAAQTRWISFLQHLLKSTGHQQVKSSTGHQQVKSSTGHQQVKSSTGHQQQRTEDTLRSFFPDHVIDKRDFKLFFHWMSTHFVTSATDKLLRDSGTSVQDFIGRQRRTGCLREPLRKTTATPDVNGEVNVHRRSGLDLNRAVFPPVKVSDDESKAGLPGHIKAELQNVIYQAEAISSYYYGNISQTAAEDLLTSQQRGVFLVRQSSAKPDRLCVSFLHTVPVRSRNSWTEMVRSRNVVLHHDLMCHEVMKTPKQTEKLDWMRTEQHIELPNSEICQQAYSALNCLVESRTKLQEFLKFHLK